MNRRRIHDIVCVIAVVSACAFICVSGCGSPRTHDLGNRKMPSARTIDSVKEAHVKELVAIPGVVGVYVGELEDHSPCIGVMVEKKTPEIEQRVPKSIDGFPVRIDETGLIKPMR